MKFTIGYYCKCIKSTCYTRCWVVVFCFVVFNAPTARDLIKFDGSFSQQLPQQPNIFKHFENLYICVFATNVLPCIAGNIKASVSNKNHVIHCIYICKKKLVFFSQFKTLPILGENIKVLVRAESQELLADFHIFHVSVSWIQLYSTPLFLKIEQIWKKMATILFFKNFLLTTYCQHLLKTLHT